MEGSPARTPRAGHPSWEACWVPPSQEATSRFPPGRLLSTGLWVSAHLMSKMLPAFFPALSLQGGLLRTQLGLVPAGEGAGFSAWYKILGDWTSSSSPITEPSVHAASTWAASLKVAPPWVGPGARAPGWGSCGFRVLGLGCPQPPSPRYQGPHAPGLAFEQSWEPSGQAGWLPLRVTLKAQLSGLPRGTVRRGADGARRGLRWDLRWTLEGAASPRAAEPQPPTRPGGSCRDEMKSHPESRCPPHLLFHGEGHRGSERAEGCLWVQLAVPCGRQPGPCPQEAPDPG